MRKMILKLTLWGYGLQSPLKGKTDTEIIGEKIEVDLKGTPVAKKE